MPIPDYQAFMLPLLEVLQDRQERPMAEVAAALANHFNLTPVERDQLLESGQQTIVSNRGAWAKTYLKKAGLLHNPVRGKVQITEEGLKVLKQKPAKIDNAFLKNYASFNTFFRPSKVADGDSPEPDATKTPEEAIDDAYQDLRNALADDLLDRVMGCSPSFFEQLVVRLLVAMGYGGTLADAGQAVGKSGDGGIDGIIKEDLLGLDVLCVQAKRWADVVGRPVVQAFAGSMEGVRARKGVLITTSSFSKEAQEFVGRLERKIVLIDGKRLTQLMIDHNIGVTAVRSYTLKRPDSDFFIEDDG